MLSWRLVAMNLMVLSLLLACSANPGALSSRPSRASQEDDIRVAVFRYQFLNNPSGQQQRAGVYCLSISEGNSDPSDLLMERFRGHSPPVKKVSACSTSPDAGVRDLETGVHGLVFRVSKITWTTDSDADVEGGYYESGLSAGGARYHVRRAGSEWIVTDHRELWIS